ncbi:MAG TPA: hypothetical protein VHM89_11550 [Acidimicrobiales bacterium]|nr:hypothetical protein [Acidimicrobiales bacterium]
MTLRIFCTVVEILLFVAVLGFFLNRITQQLVSVNKTLAKITFGVRAVETQCHAIGPAADRINANLQSVAAGLEDAAARTERLAR